MFLRSDRQRLNGSLDKLKADVVRVETKLDDHQKAFAKHEELDNERYKDLTNNVQHFVEENTKQHEDIKIAIQGNALRLALYAGGIIVAWVIIQAFLSGAIIIGG